MTIRIYVRASTKEDAERALDDLKLFSKNYNDHECVEYIENESGTKLDRPILNRLLEESSNGIRYC
jgi:DNA invertase Pin-like site-specific DNA recombinase